MKLWLAIKDRRLEGLKFRRQYPWRNYTLDFYCAELGLVIEVDGGQHAELTADRDARRSELLEQQGLLVIRFWNNDVLENLEGVLTHILDVARESKPSPQT